MKIKLTLAFLLAATGASAMDRKTNPIGGIAGQAITPATVTASTLTVTSQLSGSVWFSTTAGQLSQDNANFNYSPSGSGGPLFTVGVSTFVVNNGFVGVGTTTLKTDSIMSVYGAGTGAGILDIGNYADAATILRFTPNRTALNGIGFRNVITSFGSAGAYKLGFGQQGATYMTITNSASGTGGFVGIGTTNPATLLHLSSGTLTIDGAAPLLKLDVTANSSQQTGFFLNRSNGSSASNYIGVQNDGGSAIYLEQPSSAFTIDSIGRLANQGTLYTSGANGMQILARGAGAGAGIKFWTNDILRATMTAAGNFTLAGNLGIGLVGGASPATLLHMSSGTLTIDGAGNLKVGTDGGGIFAGTSSSTMAPVGFFSGSFASSSTITSSTFTASGTVIFSTYTLAANALKNLGDTFHVECNFYNAGSLSSPFQEVNIAGIAQNVYTSVTTTLAQTSLDAILTLVGTKTVSVRTVAQAYTASSSLSAPTTNNGGAWFNFDNTVAQTFTCRGAVTSGGTINFQYMRAGLIP